MGLHSSKHASQGDSTQTITYMTRPNLDRPMNMPGNSKYIIRGFLAAACVIGALLFYFYYSSVYGAAETNQKACEENIAREVSYDFPYLPDFMTLDDATIQQNLLDSGLQIYCTSEPTEEDPDLATTLFKLPGDIEFETGTALVDRGYDALNAKDAALLMNGSWELSINRSEGTSISFHYIDFVSGAPEQAVEAAIANLQFDESTVGEDDRGVDDIGNTYAAGSAEDSDGNSYTWRISCLPLSDMYSIKNMPETAMYVGVRVI